MLDLFSRRLLACPTSEHPNAQLACDAIKIASAGRGGRAAIDAESFFSTLEHEVLSRHQFTTKAQARAIVVAWCHEFYNAKRRHSSAEIDVTDRIREDHR